MINERIEKLRIELADALEENSVIINPLEKLNAAIGLIERAITGLNELLEIEDFLNENEEVDFFKNVKPPLIALKIEEIINYNIEINKPISSVEAEVNYYKQEIEVLQGFFRMNAFYYQYYKNGTDTLDHHFFLRNSRALVIPSSEVSLNEGPFSTPMSYLFAKFIAHETVQYQLREKIFELNNPGCQKFTQTNGKVPDLRWTGDLVNLVELIYGLWLTGQLNEGNASLNQIVRWLENNLQVSIGVIQRKFTEIEARKRVSKTKFIDQMKESILKKIESAQA